jgi:hypothetical protein
LSNSATTIWLGDPLRKYTEKNTCEVSGGSLKSGLTPISPPPTYCDAEMLSPQLVTVCGKTIS